VVLLLELEAMLLYPQNIAPTLDFSVILHMWIR
jgi:hypothetical protein